MSKLIFILINGKSSESREPSWFFFIFIVLLITETDVLAGAEFEAENRNLCVLNIGDWIDYQTSLLV